MTDVQQLVSGPITAHAFNRDRTQVAVCPNNNLVDIYSKVGNEWKVTATLGEHDKVVTCIDWAPNSNRIVTCSQDRNAYVWTFDQATNVWKPSLVLLRINRAATFVRWSPKENKFAVASGARSISICYFEQEQDWWISKHLKRPIRSTVLSLDWHPNNVLIAAGAADMKARVFSAYIKDVDEKPPPTPWGSKLPFNTICGEYSSETGGWVHSVGFSPDGNALAWASHDSTLSVVYPESQKVSSVIYNGLPFLSLIWLTPNSIVAAGHDCTPCLFSGSDSGQWSFVEKLDQGVKKASGNVTAFNKFKQMDSKGQSSDKSDTELNTVHQNTISTLLPYSGSRDRITQFSTTGVDGKLVIWDVKSIESAIAGLKIA